MNEKDEDEYEQYVEKLRKKSARTEKLGVLFYILAVVLLMLLSIVLKAVLFVWNVHWAESIHWP